MVLGCRDVSAVLCGPGERGWVPRRVDGSGDGARSVGTAWAFLGVQLSSAVDDGVGVGSLGADPGPPGLLPRA